MISKKSSSFAALGIQSLAQIGPIHQALTPQLLENVTGVTAVLLSPLSGRLFHNFPQMKWKYFAMKEWNKKSFADVWESVVFNNPLRALPYIGPIRLI